MLLKRRIVPHVGQKCRKVIDVHMSRVSRLGLRCGHEIYMPLIGKSI